MKNLKSFGLLLLLSLTFVPNRAYAYLDPGTGSMLIQVIVASCAFIVVFIGNFKVQVKAFIAKIFHKQQKEEENDDNE